MFPRDGNRSWENVSRSYQAIQSRSVGFCCRSACECLCVWRPNRFRLATHRIDKPERRNDRNWTCWKVIKRSWSERSQKPAPTTHVCMPFCGWLAWSGLGRTPLCSNGNVVRLCRVDSPHKLHPKHGLIAWTTPNWIDIVWHVRCNCRLEGKKKRNINNVFDLKRNLAGDGKNVRCANWNVLMQRVGLATHESRFCPRQSPQSVRHPRR